MLRPDVLAYLEHLTDSLSTLAPPPALACSRVIDPSAMIVTVAGQLVVDTLAILDSDTHSLIGIDVLEDRRHVK